MVLDYALRISLDWHNSLGLLLKPKLSARKPAQYLTDLDFADDIAIISESIKNAETFLQSLELGSCSSRSHMKRVKDWSHINNIHRWLLAVSFWHKHQSGRWYLGLHIMESYKDLIARKGMAWAACNKLDNIGTSDLIKTSKSVCFDQLKSQSLCMVLKHEHWQPNQKST